MNNYIKQILISGGTEGIGHAIVESLINRNYKVATFSRSFEKIENLRKKFSGPIEKKQLKIFQADVTNEIQLKEMVDQLVTEWKHVDVLINNAGHGFYVDCDKVDMLQFQKMIDVNINGTVLLTKLLVPFMKIKKNGHIINIASISGKRAFANGEFYSATKYAIMGYSEGIRNELKEFGIKVATICPGMVKTNFFSSSEIDRRKQLLNGKEPIAMKPTDISRLVQFIIEESSHCNIQDITIVPFDIEQPLDGCSQISLGK